MAERPGAKTAGSVSKKADYAFADPGANENNTPVRETTSTAALTPEPRPI